MSEIKLTEGMLKQLPRDALIKLGEVTGKFDADDAAAMSTSEMISLLVGTVVLVALLPTIMTDLVGINTSGWGTTETTLIQLLPVIVALVIFKRYAGEVQ